MGFVGFILFPLLIIVLIISLILGVLPYVFGGLGVIFMALSSVNGDKLPVRITEALRPVLKVTGIICLVIAGAGFIITLLMPAVIQFN